MEAGHAGELAVSERQKRQFTEEGYCVLEEVIAVPQLEILREECAVLMAETDSAMQAAGETGRNINHRG